MLVRKFRAFSASFGVNIKNIVRNADDETAGDYDALSILGDMNLLYIGCKTGKCTQKSIRNTIERSMALHSLAAVILMGAGINLDSLKQQLRGLEHPLYRGLPLRKFTIKGNADSEIYNWFDCFFVPADETVGALEDKLRVVLRLLAADRTVIGCMSHDTDQYPKIGYQCEEIAL